MSLVIGMKISKCGAHEPTLVAFSLLSKQRIVSRTNGQVVCKTHLQGILADRRRADRLRLVRRNRGSIVQDDEGKLAETPGIGKHSHFDDLSAPVYQASDRERSSAWEP
jgi:hypothetical protein